MMTDKELQEIKVKLSKGMPLLMNGCIICMKDDIDNLIEEIERLRELNRWIPITERPPEENKHVLLFLKDEEGVTTQVVGCLYHSDNKFLKHLNGEYKAFDGDDFSRNFLTKEYVLAWQELPENYVQ